MTIQGPIKALCGLFLLLGSGLMLWGLATAYSSARAALGADRTETATFLGYRAERVERVRRDIHEQAASPLIHHARFRWQGREYEDPVPQLVRWHSADQQVEVLVPKTEGHAPHLADRRSRYTWPLALLLFGAMCFTPPAVFLSTFSGEEVAAADGTVTKFLGGTREGLTAPGGPLESLKGLPLIPVAKGTALLLLLAAGWGLWSEYGPELAFGKNREMLHALGSKDRERALALARAGEGVNATNEYLQTPLILALDAGDAELGRALLEAGADPNVESKMRQVPLVMATKAKDVALCRLLLEKGARIDPSGDGPLFASLSAASPEVLEVLLAEEPDLTQRSSFGWTLADTAVIIGDRKMLDLLQAAAAPLSLPEPFVWVTRNDQQRFLDLVEQGGEEGRRVAALEHRELSLQKLATKLKRRAISRLLKRLEQD